MKSENGNVHLFLMFGVVIGLLLISFYLGKEMHGMKKEFKETYAKVNVMNDKLSEARVSINYIKDNLSIVNNKLKTNKYNIGDRVVYSGYQRVAKGYIREVIFDKEEMNYYYAIANSMDILVTKVYSRTSIYENAEVVGEYNITSISEACK